MSSYQRFEMRVFPILFIYIILFVMSIFMTIKLIKKWRERKVPAPLHLSLVYSTMAIATFVIMIGLLEAIITGYYKELYRFSLAFGLSAVVVWDIFLFVFVSGITEKGKKALIPLIIIGALIIFLLFLPWNWFGYPNEAYEGKLNIRLYSTGSLVLYSYAIYISIFVICQKAKKKSDDKITRVGLSLLAYSMIGMILFFLMFLLDTVMIVFTDHPGYTIFVYLAWIFAILFMVLSYMSLVMPKWLENHITKKK